MKTFTAMIIALALAGCASIEPTRVDTLKRLAIAQIEAFNKAGVDPVQLDGTALLTLQSFCALVPALTTVTRPDAPEASPEVLAACEAILKAAAKAPNG